MTAPPDRVVTREQLLADTRVVLEDVDALLRQAANSTEQQAEELRERATEALRRARIRMGEAQTVLDAKTREAVREADGWVHAHPWQAIAIGAGVSLLIGLLIARR